MNLFTFSKTLVADAERRQLRAVNMRYSWIRWFLAEIWHPLFYIFHGLDFLILNFWKIFFYVTFYTFVAYLISSAFDLPSNQIQANASAAAILGVVTVLFALPSTFSHLQLKEDDLDYLTKRILEFIASKEALQNLITNLNLMESAVNDRVNALRWSLASVWALFLFVFNQSFGLMIKVDHGENLGKVIGDSIVAFIIALVIILIPVLAIAGYRRANNQVFKGLAYACADALLRFEVKDAVQKLKQGGSICLKRSKFGTSLRS